MDMISKSKLIHGTIAANHGSFNDDFANCSS